MYKPTDKHFWDYKDENDSWIYCNCIVCFSKFGNRESETIEVIVNE